MNAKTFEDFTTTAHSAGFDEVLERRWEPDTDSMFIPTISILRQ
jgi:hypothetical protein